MIRKLYVFRFARLLRENQSKLAAKITEEQGKTIADAEGDVLRGIRKEILYTTLFLRFMLIAFICCDKIHRKLIFIIHEHKNNIFSPHY